MMKVKRVVYEHYRVGITIRAWTKNRGKPPAEMLKRFSPGRVGGAMINPRGGKTVCVIEYDNGLFSTGEATCSMSDNYCKKTGRELSRKRALSPFVSMKKKEQELGQDDLEAILIFSKKFIEIINNIINERKRRGIPVGVL